MLNFIGLGAQKCGTSWLYEALAKHPAITFPGGKEIHFWDCYRAKGLEWYKGLFVDDKCVNGDITPAYGILSVQVIKEIYKIFPEARLLYFIRNPIDRAWSAARMALQRAEMSHEEASDQWFIDHFNSRNSLAKGDYERSIRNWLSVFPRDQLLIAKYDELIADPVALANRCLTHLGLTSFFQKSDVRELSKPVFMGDGVRIRPLLKEVLSSIYEEKINSLGKYLKLDLSDWKTFNNDTRQ